MLQYNPTVSGSLTITGSLTVTNGVIGTVSGVDVQIFSSSINQVITGIQQSTGSSNLRLSNIESKSASVDISISNINSVTASNIARLSNLETKSSSVDISLSNINSITASNIARLSNLETKSSSVDISLSSINTFTSSNANTSLNSKTGSYATTGSNQFYGTQVFSGSVYIANDLIVQGSSSIQYISASSVSIGTNIVQLNTANPSVRFAGLSIIDSGSVGGSGSFLYDSVEDEFIFVHRGNGTNVTSSHFIMGPETFDNLGNETYLTCNILTKGTGKEHLVNSCIFDNGTTTCIKNNLVGTGTACFAGAICSNTAFFPGFGINGNPVSVGTSATQIRFSNSGGDLYIGQESNTAGGFYVGSKAYDNVVYTSCPFNFIFAGSSKVYITSAGNVGIGTNTPCAKLDVSYSGTETGVRLVGGSGACCGNIFRSYIADYSDGSPINLFWANHGSSARTNTLVRIHTNETAEGGYPLRITTQGSLCSPTYEALSINYNGKIGMGTVCPLNNLHVYADSGNGIGIGKNLTNANNSANLFLYPSNVTSCKRNWAITTYFDRAELLQFRRSCTTTSNPYDCGVTVMTLDGMSNNVGIGTNSPDSYLSGTKGLSIVDPTNAALGLSNGTNLWLNYLSGTTYRIWNNTNSEVMTLALNGNVGIGTFTPCSILHVKGGSAGGADFGAELRVFENTFGAVLQGSTNATTQAFLGNFRYNFNTPSNSVTNYYQAGHGISFYDGVHIYSSNPGGTSGGTFTPTKRLTINNSGNVGIGDEASTIAKVNISGSTKMNRSFYNWYQGYWTGNSTYWHMKTSMWGGGSPNGNIQYTMSLFKGYMYSYGDAAIREGTYGFHNWVGTIYNPSSGGNLFTTVYNSSDGYIVLVIPSGSGEAGVTIDWHQAYAYPFVTAQVTAAKLYGATTGGY